MKTLRSILEARAAHHRAEALRFADAAVELASIPRPTTEARVEAILAAARRARQELESAERYEAGLSSGWADRMDAAAGGAA